MDKNNQGELILEHYDRYLGKFQESKVYRINESLPSIQLLKYNNCVEGCVTYATIGLTHYSESVNNNCEVVMVVDGCHDECAGMLANILFCAAEGRMEIRSGTVIGGIDRLDKEFLAGHKKNALYFSEAYPFPDEFADIDNNVKMYMAFFISQQEYDFIMTNGAEKFEELLENMECDVFATDRESVVL